MDGYMKFEHLSHPLHPCLHAQRQSPKVYVTKLSKVLKWKGVRFSKSLDRPNIFYKVLRSTDMESDLKPYLESLKQLELNHQGPLSTVDH